MNESVDTLRQRLLTDQAVREVISRRAYELYEQRGCQPGHEIEHWLEAENEIAAYLIAGKGENLGIATFYVSQPEPERALAAPVAPGKIDPSRPGRRKAAR